MKAFFKILPVFIACSLFFLAKITFCQTVSGYITDLFNDQPVAQAVVTVEGLGTGTTNDEGFYAVGDTTNLVEFPYVITPRKQARWMFLTI